MNAANLGSTLLASGDAYRGAAGVAVFTVRVPSVYLTRMKAPPPATTWQPLQQKAAHVIVLLRAGHRAVCVWRIEWYKHPSASFSRRAATTSKPWPPQLAAGRPCALASSPCHGTGHHTVCIIGLCRQLEPNDQVF